MDTVDAFLRLHHAAGNAGWLREALRPSEPRALDSLDNAGWTPERLMAAPVADWLGMGAPIGTREAAFGPEADAYVLETGTCVYEGRAADLLRDSKLKAAYLGE